MVDYDNANVAQTDAITVNSTANNIAKFENEIKDAGIVTETVSPKLLPDYTRKVNQ